jgi:hypothetical protein
VINREVKLGIKKRIEKLEAWRAQAEIGYSRYVDVDCDSEGNPLDEKNAIIMREAEEARARGERVMIACICRIGVFGPYSQAKKPPVNPA